MWQVYLHLQLVLTPIMFNALIVTVVLIKPLPLDTYPNAKIPLTSQLHRLACEISRYHENQLVVAGFKIISIIRFWLVMHKLSYD